MKPLARVYSAVAVLAMLLALGETYMGNPTLGRWLCIAGLVLFSISLQLYQAEAIVSIRWRVADLQSRRDRPACPLAKQEAR